MKGRLSVAWEGGAVNWLELIRTLWPIASVITPLILAAGFLWLRTQFPSKAELKEIEGRLGGIATGMAEFDRRISLVEEDCKSSPSRNDLNQGLAVVAGRISGVEASVHGLERTVTTQHDYIRTVVEKAMER